MLSEQNFSAAQETKTSQDAQLRFEKAVRYNPYDVNTLLGISKFYSQVYTQTKMDTVKQRILQLGENLEKLEPNNSNVLLGIANNNIAVGDPMKGLDYIKKGLLIDPYNVTLYDNSVYYQSSQAQQYMATDKNKGLELAKNSINDYEKFMKFSLPYKANPIPDMRPLDLAKTTYVYVGQSYLLTKEYQQAVDVLSNIGQNEDKELRKQAEAIKIIALDQLGKQNEAKQVMQLTMNEFPDFGAFFADYQKRVNL